MLRLAQVRGDVLASVPPIAFRDFIRAFFPNREYVALYPTPMDMREYPIGYYSVGDWRDGI